MNHTQIHVHHGDSRTDIWHIEYIRTQLMPVMLAAEKQGTDLNDLRQLPKHKLIVANGHVQHISAPVKNILDRF